MKFKFYYFVFYIILFSSCNKLEKSNNLNLKVISIKTWQPTSVSAEIKPTIAIIIRIINNYKGFLLIIDSFKTNDQMFLEFAGKEIKKKGIHLSHQNKFDDLDDKSAINLKQNDSIDIEFLVDNNTMLAESAFLYRPKQEITSDSLYNYYLKYLDYLKTINFKVAFKINNYKVSLINCQPKTLYIKDGR